MYLKLAIRNAKRSIRDYLLYITTMTILTAIIMVSNVISIVGKMQAGFQTAALPLFIVIIMIILIEYINGFMLKQRSQEFATYMLLGMERSRLSWMYIFEISILGILCFLLGSLLGIGMIIKAYEIQLVFLLQSIIQTFLYFCVVEILSGCRIKRKIDKLHIQQLMIENKRNEKLGTRKRYKFWLPVFIVGFLCFIGLLLGIVFLPDDMGFMIISFISIPMIVTVFAFYNMIYQFVGAKRLERSINLYRRNCLYIITQITSGTKTSAVMNGVLCICLLFSSMSFVFGVIMFRSEVAFTDLSSHKWMGFLQISMSIIFIVIYFSVLSVQQIIELKREKKNMQILHYMGKTNSQVNHLVRQQILIKFAVPTIVCFVFLMIGTPILNCKLNTIFPITMNNILMKSVGGFAGCFLILYLGYLFIVCLISMRHINATVDITR